MDSVSPTMNPGNARYKSVITPACGHTGIGGVPGRTTRRAAARFLTLDVRRRERYLEDYRFGYVTGGVWFAGIRSTEQQVRRLSLR